MSRSYLLSNHTKKASSLVGPDAFLAQRFVALNLTADEGAGYRPVELQGLRREGEA